MGFDRDYQQKAIDYNARLASGTFVQQKAEWQGLQLQMQHGFMSGAYYGALLGLPMAIYKRRIRHIPMTAAGLGVAYSLNLGFSIWFRTDI